MAFVVDSMADKDEPLIPTHRYQIRGKFLSFGEKLKIKNESNQDVFVIRSKIWTLSTKLTFEDVAGNAIIKIRGEPFSHDNYTIWSAVTGEPEVHLASIVKQFSWKYKLNIESIYGEYQLEELDVLSRAFILTKNNGQLMATVSKTSFAMTDNYEVEIVDTNVEEQYENDAFILALIVVLHYTLYARFYPIVMP